MHKFKKNDVVYLNIYKQSYKEFPEKIIYLIKNNHHINDPQYLSIDEYGDENLIYESWIKVKGDKK